MRFDATFECANATNFEKKAEDDYFFEIRPDTNSDDRQWFYFAVEEAAGRRLTFRLRNASKTNCPSHWFYARPVYSSDGGTTWKRIAEKGRCDIDTDVYTFTHHVESDRDLIAYHYPYSYSDFLGKLAEWTNSPLVTREQIGSSLNGRPIEALRCGNLENPAFGFWFTARQHSAETPASFVMEGFVDFLLSDDPRAAALRAETATHIVPMINPDGVHAGNYRDNAAGVNLNRVWHEPSPDDSPEILAVTNAITRWTRGGGPYDLFVDFHADSTAHGHYAFRPSRETASKNPADCDKHFEKIVRYLNHVAAHSEEFHVGKTASYDETPGVSYRYMISAHNVPGLIPEGGYSDISYGQLAGTWLTPESHRNVGRAFAIGLYEMFLENR